MARRGKRRDTDKRGQIELTKTTFEKLVNQYPRFSYYKGDLEYQQGEDPSVFIPARRFQLEELRFLQKAVIAAGGQPGTRAQLTSHIDALENPSKEKVGTLPVLETSMLAFFKHKIINGWLFVKNAELDTMDAYLVQDVKYNPPVIDHGHRTPANTKLTAVRFSKGRSNRQTWSWETQDLREGKTVQQLLLALGIHHETPELVKEQVKIEKDFLAWRKSLGMQFRGEGSFEAKKDDDENSFWSDFKEKDMHNARLVVDDRCDAIERHERTSIFLLDEDDDESAVNPEEAEKYSVMPLDPYIWCFNLDSHQEGWVHRGSMTPYQYNPGVRDKLILPPEHEDLIDALTADMDVLLDDIVSGKSGGTAIMCQGKAGTGKTLTAEVYAEVVKKPLYRVHSGQLGIDAEGVESTLKIALERAKRWKAIMLIDEADVFVMKRGLNLELNAVCGVFLRLLEYYDGLIFLTTNRLDDIDDAILSRCIATIQFKPPGFEERKRIWESLGKTFGLKLVGDPRVVTKLAQEFNEATGRDIKGLIRLAIKYARQRKKVPTFEDIKRFAPYRGM